jgi:hypothetical protein
MKTMTNGAIVSLPTGEKHHYSNVSSYGMRKSRSGTAAVLTFSDGSKHTVDGATEVVGAAPDYLMWHTLSGAESKPLAF